MGARADTYVALGSSFAAGPGIEPLVAPPNGRSGGNYPHLVAQSLGLRLIDVTSLGATVDHVLSVPQVLLDGSCVPAQLAALRPDTTLVTVTVGGNDVQYALSLMRLSAQVAPEAVPPVMRAALAKAVELENISTELARLSGRLVGLVDAVHEAAPRARVVLVDSLTVVGPPGPAMPMNGRDLAWCARLGLAVEAATAAAAAQTGVELVRAGSASRDHAVGSPDPWVGGWVFGDVVAGGSLPYHPNAVGMRAVADLVIGVVDH